MNFPSYTPVGEIRAAAILTGSYVVAATFGDSNGSPTGLTTTPEQAVNNESTDLVLDLAFTKGSLTSCDVAVDFSTDGSTWFAEGSEAVSAGVATITSKVHRMSANFTGTITVPVSHPYVRVKALGTGTVTSSSLAISAHFIRKER